jgi:hypothetical protein
MMRCGCVKERPRNLLKALAGIYHVVDFGNLLVKDGKRAVRRAAAARYEN